MGIFHCVIIPQLVFNRIQNEPPLFPPLQQSPPFIKKTFMCTIFGDIRRKLIIILLTRSLSCATYKQLSKKKLFHSQLHK